MLADCCVQPSLAREPTWDMPFQGRVGEATNTGQHTYRIALTNRSLSLMGSLLKSTMLICSRQLKQLLLPKPKRSSPQAFVSIDSKPAGQHRSLTTGPIVIVSNHSGGKQGVLLSFPGIQCDQRSTRSSRLELLITWSIIAGDFNCDPTSLEAWSTFRLPGFQSTTALFASKYGIPMPTTCKDATWPDVLLLCPAIQRGLQHIAVLPI